MRLMLSFGADGQTGWLKFWIRSGAFILLTEKAGLPGMSIPALWHRGIFGPVLESIPLPVQNFT